MQQLDWRLLQMFLATVDAGSISGAAEQMGVSVTTMRTALDRLEGLFEEPLLRRTHQGIVLTPRGQALAQSAAPAAEALREVEAGTSAKDRGLPACRVSCSVVAYKTVLAASLKDVFTRTSGLNLILSPDDEVLNLNDQDVDISIRHRRPAQESFIAQEVGSIRFGLYAPGSVTSLGDALKSYPLATTPSEVKLAAALGLDLASAPFATSRLVSFATYGFVTDAVLNQSCLGLLPEVLGRAAPDLNRIELGIDIPTLPVWVCRKRSVTENRQTGEVFRALKSILKTALA